MGIDYTEEKVVGVVHEKDTKQMDLSGLDDSDQAIIEKNLDRLQQFIRDIADIRKANPAVADHLMQSLSSKQSAVFAESEVIASRIRRGQVEMLTVSPTSSDSYYLQEKDESIV